MSVWHEPCEECYWLPGSVWAHDRRRKPARSRWVCTLCKTKIEAPWRAEDAIRRAAIAARCKTQARKVRAMAMKVRPVILGDRLGDCWQEIQVSAPPVA